MIQISGSKIYLSKVDIGKLQPIACYCTPLSQEWLLNFQNFFNQKKNTIS